MVSRFYRLAILFLAVFITLSACAPITEDANHTGGTAVGVGVGGLLGLGSAALLHASKPVMGLAALGGAGLGYYLTTMRFDARGIVKVGGKVYTLGDYVMIEIPGDNLFEPNTAEFLPGSDVVLDSIADVLKRYPSHNIIISGNTSGFDSRYERTLSEQRAAQIAGYLWSHGITNGDAPTQAAGGRSLIYVGYGDAVPIANHIHLDGILANSRVQIVASPSAAALYWNRCNKCFKPFNNIGDEELWGTKRHPDHYADAFPEGS